MSLIGAGFSYWDAYHMAPRDTRRFLGIYNAWSIPSDQRADGVRIATAADIASEFASG